MKFIRSFTFSLCAALALIGGGAFARPSGGDGKEAPAARQGGAAKKETAAKETPAAAEAGAVKVSEIREAGLKELRERSAGAGRVLLVNFWATWCTPCREEFPDLVKLRGQYAADKLDLVFVSLDDISEINTTVPEFLAQTKATGMPSYLLNADDADAAINLFDPEWRGELPATFVYGPAGALAYKHRGRIKPAEVRAAIDQAIGAKAGP